MNSASPAQAPPRQLLVLNPNSTPAMTEAVLTELQALAGSSLRLRGLTAADGPPVIATAQSFEAGARAAQRALEAQREPWPDAVLLACFGDPGLHTLRALSPVPVLGMAESSVLQALARGRPFHLLTAGAAWGPLLRDAVARVPGALPLLHGISTLQGTGLAATQSRADFVQRVQVVLDALAQQGSPDCVLGGAAFAGLQHLLRYPGRLSDGLRDALAQWQGQPPAVSA